MPDIDKTREELIEELNMMRLEVAQLKASQETCAFNQKHGIEKDETPCNKLFAQALQNEPASGGGSTGFRGIGRSFEQVFDHTGFY